jgi:tetrahydromethanopterin S-methyltransferase F subunit
LNKILFFKFLAAAYEIRYTQNETDFSNKTAWTELPSISSEDVVNGNFTPIEAGELVTFEISKDLFEDNQVYYLAMRALDKNNLVSEISTPYQLNTLPIPDSEDDSGLSGGAIAGIVIGVLLAVLLVAVVAYLVVKKQKQSHGKK